MNYQIISKLIPLCLILMLGCNQEDFLSQEEELSKSLKKKTMKVMVSKADIFTFQPAGSFGGGVLTPGTFYPTTKNSFSKMKRTPGYISYNLHTTGLPAGAYTNWFVIFNNPEYCVDGCGEDDLFTPEVNASAFWSDGKVVQHNGVGNFSGKTHIGDFPSDPAQIAFLGSPAGLVDPYKAEVHIVIKYHGPASDDPDILYEQLYHFTGACESNANAYDLGFPFGIQCFDPQVAVHLAP